jgi:glutamate receptor ionotropic, NMDA 3A
MRRKRKKKKIYDVKLYEYQTLIRRYQFSLFHNRTRCCYGLSMDLLDNVASELGFGYILYIVSDELFGSKQMMRQQNILQNVIDTSRPIDAVQEHLRDRDREREKERFERNNRRFNKKNPDQSAWNGIVGDLVVGSADMSFAPLSVSK